MNYEIFEPSRELAMLVKCYWIMESSENETIEKQSVVPDGCMEMIFHYGDLYRQYTAEGNSIIQPRCFVIGQLTRPLEIKPTGKTGIFSVRFHPNGFLPFTNVPVKELEDTAVSLEKLFGKKGLEIERNILKASSSIEKINLIETFLTNRLTDTQTIDHIVKSTVETILTANGQLTVAELSRQVNIDRRQLERKFHSGIGLSPKQLLKTVRIQTTLKMLLAHEFTNLTSLAHENGYYDQAHFIKDFREFVGLTPKEFYKKSLKMTSFFIKD